MNARILLSTVTAFALIVSAVAQDATGQPAPEATSEPGAAPSGNATDSPAPAPSESPDANPTQPALPEAPANPTDINLIPEAATDPTAPPMVAPDLDSSTLLPPLPEPFLSAGGQRPPSLARVQDDGTAQRIRFRNVRSKIEQSTDLQELWELSEAAPTDAERRHHLAEYYKLLFKRILKADPSLGPLVEERKKEALSQFEFDRLQPSVWREGE